ncbi:hypothetical protein ABDF71_25355 [Ochrobactrum sp. WV_118_8]
MTDIENRTINFADRYIGFKMSSAGGIGKSRDSTETVDILRSSSSLTTIAIDGDSDEPLANETLYKTMGNREGGNHFGALLPASEQDPYTGVLTVNLRKANARSGDVIFNAMGTEADRIWVDGAGGSEPNFGKLLMEDNGDPEFFVETISEAGYGLVISLIALPSNHSRCEDAAESIRYYFELYGSFPSVHFVVTMNMWGSEKLDDMGDPSFAYWYNSKTRKAMMESGRLSEIKMPSLAKDMFKIFGDFASKECGAPLSKIIDKDFAQANGVPFRQRSTIARTRVIYMKQIEADPFLKHFFGIA